MAESCDEHYDKINECEGLETLFKDSLQKCVHKSDVVIVYAHYLLIEELGYGCVEVERDQNGEMKEIYKTVNSLPTNWDKGYQPYNLKYKTEKETRILSAQKNSRNMIVYFSNEGCDQNKISSEIILNNYIPNQFLRTNDLSLIERLSELRSILLACFEKNDKFKAKRDHDQDLIQNKFSSRKKSAKKFPSITKELIDPCYPLLNDRGDARPPFLCLKKADEDSTKGQFCLQKKNKHKPIDSNRVNLEFLNDPNYIIAEDPVGPPDGSYIK